MPVQFQAPGPPSVKEAEQTLKAAREAERAAKRKRTVSV
jgi:hypothetical protein